MMHDDVAYAANRTQSYGGLLPPQTGEQYEVGVKAGFLDRRLLATLAFYHLTKQNLPLQPVDATHVLLSGESRSQGIELDLSGQITDNLSVIGSYAYTDVQVVRADSFQGNRLDGVPRHAGSLWARYDFRDYPPLNGLSLGLGAYFVGDRPGDPANTFILPAYTRLDAFAAYRFQIGATKLTAQLNIWNRLDRKYHDSSDPNSNVAPALGIAPGIPLTVIGSIRVGF